MLIDFFSAKSKRVFRTVGVIGTGMLPLAGLATPAHAQSLQDALKQTTITGNAGVYDFTYANQAHTGDTKNAFAVGGDLIIHSGAFEG
ncbi:hypothetical protein SAMN02746095_03920, partial [Acidocella aminolytica 101 = DSM 11237]